MHAIDLPVQLVQCANECFSFFLGDLRPFFVWSNCETNTLCADVYKKACGQLRTNMRLSAQSLVSRSWRTMCPLRHRATTCGVELGVAFTLRNGDNAAYNAIHERR